VALVFDGLDTIVSVFLNNKLILESRNMHRAYHVDVTESLNRDGDGNNVLELRFSNAPEYGRKEMKRIGYKGNNTDVHFGSCLSRHVFSCGDNLQRWRRANAKL
jgi:beta-mannosidase